MRLGINGFGRIGRQAFRIALDHSAVEVVHVNDIADVPTLAHLLKYDSTYGIWNRDVRGEEGRIVIDGKAITSGAEKDPTKLPWRDKGADVVLESSGKFTRREDAQKHLDAGAKKVLVSAPGKSPLDGDFVIGVNEEQYDPKRHHVISIGSCTTNCVATMAKVLHAEFGIVHGLMITVHAYTADQNLQDGPHKDLRRARAAATNIVPTSTGAAKAIGKIIPELDGKLDGLALRVPVSCGSITDLTCRIEKQASVDQVNDAMRRWAGERMKGVLQVAEDLIVSSDIVGNSHSCIFVPQDTRVIDGAFVKILGWYDNEWGFSTRLVEMLNRMVPPV